MIVRGREIANEMLDTVASEVAVCANPPRLTVFTCAPNFATKKFLSIKKKAAERIGILVRVEEFEEQVTTDKVLEAIADAQKVSEGIIIQLPFPEHVDVAALLKALPAMYDVDAIGVEAVALAKEDAAVVLSPVAGAIAEIVAQHAVTITGKKAVVLGRGRLVGTPAAIWLQNEGAEVHVLDRNTDNIESETKDADILVLGAGVPRIITPEMVKDGVAIFDAGTSEDAGELVGDADPACAKKASLFTPVPGGIGPVTVAVIFKNLLTLSREQDKN